MVYNADQTADRAAADTLNDPGYCLQQCRIWAGINSLYPDASTAWYNTNDRHPGNRNPPRGSMVYWTGGSHGYGHIACSMGGGKVRSTDAGGAGRVATVDLGWVESHWGLPYAGWAWDVNEVTIPHGEQPPEEEDMPKYVRAKATTDRQFAANSGWHNIEWDSIQSGDDVMDPGQSYIKIKDKLFTATVSLTVSTSAEVVKTRFIERKKQGDGYVDAEEYPTLESPTSGGNTYAIDSRTQKCNDERLVAQVNLSEAGGTLLGAELNLLYF